MTWSIDSVVFACIMGILVVSEMVKYKLFVEKLFGFSISYFWRITAIFSTMLVAFSWIDIVFFMYKVIIMIFSAIVFLLLSKGDWRKKVIFIPMTFFLFTYVDEILSRIIDFIIKSKLLKQNQYSYLLSNFIAIVMIIFVYFHKENNNNKIKKIFTWIFLVLIGISMPYVIITLENIINDLQDEQIVNKVQQLIVILFVGLVMLLIVILYVYDMNMKTKQYLENEIMLKETQKKYYESMLEKEEKTRRYRHDMSNHLVCLKGLAQGEENFKIIEYIDQMQTQFVEIQNSCYSVGNQILDVILNHWISQIQSGNIKVSGVCSDEIEIDSISLCIIFSNLLQNAVEELKDIDEENSNLNIHVNQKKDHIKIEIANTSRDKVFNKKTNLPKTTKRDKENHGIGLKNVKETIEKNRGYFECLWCDGIFKVSVILPLKKAI